MLPHRAAAARGADAAVPAGRLPALVGGRLEPLLAALPHAGETCCKSIFNEDIGDGRTESYVEFQFIL